MEDMVKCIQKVPKLNRASKWKQPNILGYLPFPLRDAITAKTWKKCYNLHDIQSAVQKVRKVGFNEKTVGMSLLCPVILHYFSRLQTCIVHTHVNTYYCYNFI